MKTNTNGTSEHTHITLDDYSCFAKYLPSKSTLADFEKISDIAHKVETCAVCKRLFFAYKAEERRSISEAISEETAVDVTDTLTEAILSYIERAKQAAQELGNTLIESFFVQPRLVPAVMRSVRGNGSQSEETDIVIHDAGGGFFSFALEKETDVTIKDFRITEIPQQLLDNLAAVILIIKRVDDEQQAEISVGVLRYDPSPAQISFEDVCLPAGNYVFYVAQNKGGH